MAGAQLFLRSAELLCKKSAGAGCSGVTAASSGHEKALREKSRQG